MTLIKHTDAPVFEAEGTTVTAYAAPSRGASELSVWRLELAPGSTSPLHHMDREEVFLGLEGEAIAMVGGTAFTLHVPGPRPFRALACLPAGGLATLDPGGETFAPPWAV